MTTTLTSNRYRIEQLDNRYMKEYVRAITSPWFNEYHRVKYQGKPSLDELVVKMSKFIEGRYIITDSNRTMVGGIARVIEDGDIAIAYFIVPEHQGKGIATGALKKFTETMVCKYREITLNIMKGNTASIRVAEKSGYKYSGSNGDVLKYKFVR